MTAYHYNYVAEVGHPMMGKIINFGNKVEVNIRSLDVVSFLFV